MRKVVIEPRMLTKDQAAAYCGVSVPVFARVCPVTPVDLGSDARTIRWDRKLLDVWLDALGPTTEDAADDYWIAKMRGAGSIQVKLDAWDPKKENEERRARRRRRQTDRA